MKYSIEKDELSVKSFFQELLKKKEDEDLKIFTLFNIFD